MKMKERYVVDVVNLRSKLKNGELKEADIVKLLDYGDSISDDNVNAQIEGMKAETIEKINKNAEIEKAIDRKKIIYKGDVGER